MADALLTLWYLFRRRARAPVVPPLTEVRLNFAHQRDARLNFAHERAVEIDFPVEPGEMLMAPRGARAKPARRRAAAKAT